MSQKAANDDNLVAALRAFKAADEINDVMAHNDATDYEMLQFLGTFLACFLKVKKTEGHDVAIYKKNLFHIINDEIDTAFKIASIYGWEEE